MATLTTHPNCPRYSDRVAVHRTNDVSSQIPHRRNGLLLAASAAGCRARCFQDNSCFRSAMASRNMDQGIWDEQHERWPQEVSKEGAPPVIEERAVGLHGVGDHLRSVDGKSVCFATCNSR